MHPTLNENGGGNLLLAGLSFRHVYLVSRTCPKLRVPTSSGNHGKPGKSSKIPCMEKSWNLKKMNNDGKIMEFC